MAASLVAKDLILHGRRHIGMPSGSTPSTQEGETTVAQSARYVGRRIRDIASNHEEPVGRVAPELIDQTVFPIEIGLHRVACDIGALIGTPVAL
jgi:hypothetical protein